MAIAGGVNLYLHPSSYIGLCAQQMLSADGQCKSFGLGSNGFVPGEGVGIVLLKPLSRAIARSRSYLRGNPEHQYQSRRENQRLYGAESQCTRGTNPGGSG